MLVLITPAIIYLIYHWYATQPIRIATAAVSSPKSIQELPKKNQEILQYIENQGKTLAPTYQEVVCTDYVINVLSNFYNLSPQEKRGIQIITEENLHDLIESDAAVIKGVYTALTVSGKGIPVTREQVLPGDFVQFWNVMGTGCYGHCGVIKSIEDQEITLYSSHPITNGFGVHTYRMPHKAYFVRLK